MSIVSPGKPTSTDTIVRSPAALNQGIDLRKSSLCADLSMFFRTVAFADSRPRNTPRQPASFISQTVSSSVWSQRKKQCHRKSYSLRIIISSIWRNCRRGTLSVASMKKMWLIEPVALIASNSRSIRSSVMCR